MTSPAALVQLLVAHLPAERREEALRSDVEVMLSALWQTAREAWPTVDVPPDIFMSHLADRCAGAAPLSDQLHQLHTADLYLVSACEAGSRAALEALEALCTQAARSVLSKDTAAGLNLDDLQQLLLEKLLVAEDGHEPRLRRYGGRGALRKWIHMVALREVLHKVRGKAVSSAGPAALDELLRALPDPAESAELAHFKNAHGPQLKAAIQAALEALSPRERNLLRQHFLHGLSFEQIASLYRVHRVTMARWYRKVRLSLLEHTRLSLAAQLNLPPEQLDSLAGNLLSQVSLSLDRLLEPTGE